MANNSEEMSPRTVFANAWPQLVRGRGPRRAIGMIGLSAQLVQAKEAINWYESDSAQPTTEEKEALASAAALAERLHEFLNRSDHNRTIASEVMKLALYLEQVTSQEKPGGALAPSGYGKLLGDMSNDVLASTNQKLVR